MTREEHLEQRSRPSRLLTGSKRDTSARFVSSAAQTEKILSTMKKLKSPLDQLAQQSTPSSASSWAECYLDSQKKKSCENEAEIDNDDVPPPTATVPRVVFPQPVSSSLGSTLNTALDTSKSTNAVSNGATSMLSPQTVSMTPASTAEASTFEQLQFQTIGEFKFTLPQGAKQVDLDYIDARVEFEFSPPPSMREPPVQTPNRKFVRKFFDNFPVPYDFMPPSPKMHATYAVSKPLTVKESEESKADAKKPVVAETTEESGSGSTAATPATSLNGAVNPLARFMQLKPGQWKCPGCSVLNEGTSAKCPCCESAKPGGGAAEKTSSAAPNAPGKILSSDFSFGVATVDANKDTDKPAAGSSTDGGFNFEALYADSKKDTEKPAVTINFYGCTFGASRADATKYAEKFATVITSGKINVMAHVASSEEPAAGYSSFGSTAVSNASADSSASTAPVSLGYLVSDDERTKMSAVTEKVPSAPSFSFDVPAASSSAPDQPSVATNLPIGFTFGATSVNTADGASKGKRKASEARVPTSEFAPSFSFGATTTTNTEAPKANTVSGFSFGVALEPNGASPMEIDRPTKRLARSTAAPSVFIEALNQASAPSVPSAAQPVFSFRASSAPAPSGYGAAPAVANGFGAAPGGFRPMTPAPAFGNQAAPAFGSNLPPPTSMSGAPAFGAAVSSGFSSGWPSFGFHSSSPSPAFGAAQAVPAFGIAPNTAFGTAPTPGFGAAAPAPGFGATAPAPGFGAIAPAPGFGAPAAGAFGTSAGGGFHMGVTPQHAKGRRILKAKSRTRRTS